MRMKIIITLLAAALICPGAYSMTGIDAWGTSRDVTIKKQALAANNFTEFSPADHPEYENKIMNYIVAIDANLKNKINIVRTKEDPRRDFLFVNNKLYSVLEDYGKISNDKFQSIIRNLSGVFGRPSVQQDRNMTIHTFFNDKTKVLVLSNAKGGAVECRIYLYSGKLFKMLMSE